MSERQDKEKSDIMAKHTNILVCFLSDIGNNCMTRKLKVSKMLQCFM